MLPVYAAPERYRPGLTDLSEETTAGGRKGPDQRAAEERRVEQVAEAGGRDEQDRGGQSRP